MRTLRNFRLVRVITLITALSLFWLQIGPVLAGTAIQSRHDRQEMRLRLDAARRASKLAPGLTQTPDAALRKKITAREKAAQEAAIRPLADVRPLSLGEMARAHGRGSLRNPYFAGEAMPWQRSFHGVNICDGNLFKSFTDLQVAPARGAGLVLQRTYSSNDARVGPFGVGWTHAYDIRIQEATAVQTESGNPSAVSVQPVSGSAQPGGSDTVNEVPRTDFFGAKHTYHRDADGLYSPPAYLYDEMNSDYDTSLANGPAKVEDDTEKGMDGTVKHYANVLTLADGTEGNERACDYIQDRYGNRTTLTYGQSYVQPDGSTRKILTQVTDPTGRSLAFTWTNFGTTAQPAYRITEADAPTDPATGAVVYRVVYAYYGANDPDAGGAAYQLKSVTLDPDNLNQTTTYKYTSFTGSYIDQNKTSQIATEAGLLTSITDPLGETVRYAYATQYHCTLYDGGGSVQVTGSTNTNTVWVYQVTEPAGVDASNTPRTITWTIVTTFGGNGDNRLITDALGGQGITIGCASDPYGRLTYLENCKENGDYAFIGGDPTGYVLTYDNDNNLLYTERFRACDVGYNSTSNTTPWHLSIFQNDMSTYGDHGNMLTHRFSANVEDMIDNPLFPGNDPYPGQEGATYYNASQYFQKQSSTDMDGHTTFMVVGTDTAGTAADPDPNSGDRGQVLAVQDAGYNDSASPSYHRQYSYTYNQYGQKLTETNLNGTVTQYTYGTTGTDLGNLVKVVQDPGGPGYLSRTTSMHYDVMGRVLQSIDPKGQESDFQYNSLGQPLAVTSKDNRGVAQETITYDYAANGRTQSVRDNRGLTTLDYEAGCDRVHSVTDPLTRAVTYTYMLTGERRSVLLSTGHTWTYTYSDPFNATYVLASDDPSKVSLRLESVTDDQGRRVDYNFAGNGKLLSKRLDQSYNTSGNLVSYCETGFIYDNGSAFKNYLNATQTSRDWVIQMKTKWYAASEGPTGDPYTIQRVLSENDYTYDNLGQRLTNTVSRQPLDAAGNPQMTNGTPVLTSRTETYTYDDLNRLSTVDYGDGQTQTYGFDAMGNRLSKQDSVAGTTSYGYEAANRLTNVGSQTYQNDADGNTLTDGTHINTWDSQNRLTSSTVGGTVSAFTYGADGLRRSSTVTPAGGSATVTQQVYDGSMLVQEWHGSASLATYLNGPAGPECRIDETSASEAGTTSSGPIVQRGPTKWYLYDGLGSVVGEVDPGGNLTSSGTFDVYGAKRQGGTGTSTSRQGFVGSLGHVSDAETGLVYMRARYYDPNVGRFVSEDPGRDGSNWFVYCGNNPVNNTDRTGKSYEWINSVISGPQWFIDGIKQAALEGQESLAEYMEENFRLSMNITRGLGAGIGGSLQLRLMLRSAMLNSLVDDEEEIGVGSYESVSEVGTLIGEAAEGELADMATGEIVASFTSLL